MYIQLVETPKDQMKSRHISSSNIVYKNISMESTLTQEEFTAQHWHPLYPQCLPPYTQT